MEEQNKEQKDSIKLIKGQRGSYGWEIKIHSLEGKEINESDIQRLDKIVVELNRRYKND